jgi:hypothetical protein
MGFKQTKYAGLDQQALAKFYEQQFAAAKKRGFDDKKAHDHAAFMVDYYGHQFRQYA